MALRCLLFSSDEATADPIRRVLTELGVEAEHCSNPVDAVERVTGQSFQIVITDWKDQPEAAFLLKTARDLKAAARPLTLAIVNEEGRPHALQAGANSVLLNPIRPEQVRETMGTACQLLQSKLQSATSASTRPQWQPGISNVPGASGAAAAPAPAFTAAPEKLRAGEFLQSTGPTPGLQFDTESEIRDAIGTPSTPVDSLTELEPMAAAVQDVPQAKPEAKGALTGWAALQARLIKSRPAPLKEVGAQNELTRFDDASAPGQTGSPAAFETFPSQATKRLDAADDAGGIAPREEAVPSRTPGQREDEDGEIAVIRPRRAKHGKTFVLGFALVSVVLVAVPRTREQLRMLSRTGARAALRWLNPPPPPIPQTVTQHDSFGQPDDEYKLPATSNIPDSTTDPSKIEVVPVIDPTAKQDKSAANAGQGVSGGNGVQSASSDQPAATSGQGAPADQNSAANAQNPPVSTPISNPVTGATGTNTSGNSGMAAAATGTTSTPPQSAPAQAASGPSAAAQPAPPVSAPAPQPTQTQATQVSSARPAAVHTTPTPQVSASQLAGIPSSLKSQVASTTPDMSGVRPDDSAPSSLEPVALPEAALRSLLAQGADPEYPPSAKASGLQGSVVLQVLIGTDGAVRDAKFMQGSFVFARAAIDAVKQWRFKPYSVNGHPVSVQSVVTLNFKPPA